jgi:hypothetical protein
MKDTMNDTMGDDDVIARLRSALDEVAATGTSAGTSTEDGLAGPPDSDAAPVITLRTDAVGHRPTRAWLGIAAATAVLVGAGGWVLTQRSTPQTTTAGTAVDTTAVLPVAPSGPWFELQLADAVAGPVQSSALDADEGGFTQSWVVTRPNDAAALGVLDIRVRYDEDGLGATADPNAFVAVAAPQGSAWSAADPMSAGGFALVWQRGDGTVWWVSQAGMIDPSTGGTAGFAEYVFQIQRGTFNDLLTNPDQQAEWVRATPAGAFVHLSQSYEVGSQSAGVVLAVTGAPLLSVLAGTTDLTEVMVAGNRGWTGTRPDGEVTVVWLVDTDRWGLLRISPLLADRVDEIVEAVTPVATDVGEPAPVQTTVVPVTDPVTPPASTTAPMENAVRTDYPDLSIVSARIVPGPVQVAPAPVTDALGQVWRVQGDSLDGLLMMNVEELVVDEEYLAQEGFTTITALDGVSEGAAWLIDGRTDDTGMDYRPGIVWARPDGTSWWFAEQGLSDTGTTDWIDLVLSAVPGSGVPVVITDERAGLLSVFGPPTTFVSRSFTDVDGGTAALTLTDSATQLSSLFFAESVTEIEVDGRTGWRVEDDALGWVTVWWDAGDGWFAELRFFQGLAERADEIIAANLVRLDG